MGDNVQAEVNDAIFKDPTEFLVLCDKLRAWEKGDEEEGTIGGLHANVHVNVCEA